MSPITLVFALALFNFATSQASRVLLALYALDLGAEPFIVGAISATYSAFPMLLAWLAGRVTDRLGAARPLAFGAVAAGCGMLVPWFWPGMPSLYIASALCGFSFTFFTVALQNMAGQFGEKGGRAKSYSNYAMVVSFATFLGPLIAGFGIDHIGFGPTCVSIALLTLVTLVLVAVNRSDLPPGAPASGAAESMGGILADRKVRKVLITSSLIVSGTDLFQFYLPIYGHQIGLSASAIGVVLSMFAAASVVVRLIIPRLLARFSVEGVLAYAFFLGAAGFFALPFFHHAVMLGAISFVFGLGMGCGAPITLMQTYSQSPPGRSGEALGLRMMANHAARVAGPLLFGSIGSAFGLFPVFWMNGLMLASGGAVSRRGQPGAPREP